MKPIQYAAGSRYSHPDPNAARHAKKRPCNTADKNAAMFRVLSALHELWLGGGGGNEVLDVDLVVRLARALVKLGKTNGEEVLPLVKTASDALKQADADLCAGRPATLSGDGYRAVCSLMNRHQDALERYSGQTLEDAQALVRKELADEVRKARAAAEVVG